MGSGGWDTWQMSRPLMTGAGSGAGAGTEDFQQEIQRLEEQLRQAAGPAVPGPP